MRLMLIDVLYRRNSLNKGKSKPDEKYKGLRGCLFDFDENLMYFNDTSFRNLGGLDIKLYLIKPDGSTQFIMPLFTSPLTRIYVDDRYIMLETEKSVYKTQRVG